MAAMEAERAMPRRGLDLLEVVADQGGAIRVDLGARGEPTASKAAMYASVLFGAPGVDGDHADDAGQDRDAATDGRVPDGRAHASRRRDGEDCPDLD